MTTTATELKMEPTLKTEAILQLFKRKDVREKAQVILNLIEEKLAEGRINLILSFYANQDRFEFNGISHKNYRSVMAQLVKAEVLIKVKDAKRGVSYEEYQVNYDFVIFPKREAVFGRTRDIYYYILENHGYQAWYDMKIRIYKAGHKRATFKRLLEEATASGLIEEAGR